MRKKRDRAAKYFDEILHSSSANRPNFSIESKKKAKPEEEGKKHRRNLQDADLFIHECGFIRPQLTGYTALDMSSDENLLAIGRTDCSIILAKRFSTRWIPISEIPASSEIPELSITSVKFSPCGKYIFVARLTGKLTIFKISSLDGLVKFLEFKLGGGAIWDVQFSPFEKSQNLFLLAIACDDGSIKFLLPDENYLSLDSNEYPDDISHYIIKTTSASDARILCLSWIKNAKNISAKLLASGDSEGGVKCLNYNTLKSINNVHGKLPADKNNNPIPIWSIQTIASNHQIKLICGDDRGLISVWSLNTMTMESEIHIEGVKGPMWSSTELKSDNESLILFGCANGTISGLTFNYSTNSYTTIRSKYAHTHDVRGIITKHQKIYSASIDAKIKCLSSSDLFGNRIAYAHSNILLGLIARSPLVQVIKQSNLLVCSGNDKQLEFWKLNTKQNSNGPELKLKMTLDNTDLQIRSFAVSSNSCYVAVSDVKSFRIYKIWNENDDFSTFGMVQPLTIDWNIERKLNGSNDIAIYKTSIFAISKNKQSLLAYDFKSKEGLSMNISESFKGEAVYLNRVLCSDNGMLVVSDSRGFLYMTIVEDDVDNVNTTPLKWSKVKVSNKKMNSQIITAIGISPKANVVVVAAASGCITRMTFIAGDNGNKISKIIGRRKKNLIISSITVGDNGNHILVSDDRDAAILLFKDPKPASNSDDKSMGMQEQDGDYEIDGFEQIIESIDNNLRSYPINLTKETGVLFSTGLITEGQLVSVSLRDDVLKSELPDAIPRKKFGQ